VLRDAGRPALSRPVVVVSQRLGAIGSEELRIEGAGAELRSLPMWTVEEIGANAAEADVVLVGAVEPFDALAIPGLPVCRAIVRRGVGYDNVDTESATNAGIVVANVPDASVEEVSDHAFAMLVALERRIAPLDRAVHAGVWRRDPQDIAAVREGVRRMRELTLGIVGFGRIGRALHRKAAASYARVLVADPVAAAEDVVATGATLVALNDLLGASDHVSLHAPLLPGTRHLIRAETLARLPSDAIVVNTSRGGLVDEAALLAALDEGRLGGAGLDVTEHEPLLDDDPLLRHDRVLLTAHSAASSATANAELQRRSVDAVIDVLEGRRPASVVNPEVFASGRLRARDLV
jgi:D-3-phosphoglycerate dehydrogenase / 2-oxoglutarate reductase